MHKKAALAAAAALAVAAILAQVSCATDTARPALPSSGGAFPAYPDARIAVFSDPHYFDPELWTDGKGLEAYLRQDRKLLRESPRILEEALRIVREQDVDFVVVPGDLTKDGEASSHRALAGGLAMLEEAGIPVYLINGNHDVANREAARFVGDTASPVPSVTAEEFAEIYGRFGYGEALARDPDSLSYIAEPVEGLWLLALEGCLYRQQPRDGHSPAGGKLSAATMAWIEDILARAARERKAVLAVMHHGVTEHYAGQRKHYGEYVIDDAPAVSALLARHGVRLVLTGHYHAQDITLVRTPGAGFLYDIETGSLVTWPCPVRIAEFSGNRLSVRTSLVTEIEGVPGDFGQFARGYAFDGIAGIAVDTLRGMKVREKDCLAIAPQVADAFLAHYAGDEKPPALALDSRGIGFMGRLVLANRKSLVEGLWKDLEPADDGITIDMASGAWSSNRGQGSP